MAIVMGEAGYEILSSSMVVASLGKLTDVRSSSWVTLSWEEERAKAARLGRGRA